MSRVRNVHGGTEKYTRIITADKMDRKSHAYHEYSVWLPSDPGGRGPSVVAKITFQKGPIAEVGVNGCSNEDLLAIVVDRLECFQAGRFPCNENVRALLYVQQALSTLNDRTDDREKRGVEGQHKA